MRLLKMDAEAVQKLIEGMEEECNTIRQNSLTLAWYMRGGASYEDILNMSITERNYVNKLIEKNLETTKNTKLPFF